jgi:hypothetical protein
MKAVNRLASEASRFYDIYRVPARTNSCPPASVGFDVSPKELVHHQTPSVHNTLNRLASDVLQFGFVYPDTREFFQKKDFFVRRVPSPTLEARTQENAVHMKELNRLAKLFEITSSPSVQLYPAFQTKTASFDRDNKKMYSPGFKNPYEVSLRAKLNLTEETRFIDAFPKTDRPKISLMNGAPTIDRTVFNSLLRLKLQSAQQILCVQHLSTNIVKRIVHWIRTILFGLTIKKKPAASKRVAPASRTVDFAPPQGSNTPKSSANQDVEPPTTEESRPSTPVPDVPPPSPTSSIPANWLRDAAMVFLPQVEGLNQLSDPESRFRKVSDDFISTTPAPLPPISVSSKDIYEFKYSIKFLINAIAVGVAYDNPKFVEELANARSRLLAIRDVLGLKFTLHSRSETVPYMHGVSDPATWQASDAYPEGVVTLVHSHLTFPPIYIALFADIYTYRDYLPPILTYLSEFSPF